MQITNVMFDDIQGLKGGAIYIKEGVNNTMISDSTFSNCRAQSGGAIYAQDLMLTIKNTQFNSNKATSNEDTSLAEASDQQQQMKNLRSNIANRYQIGGAFFIEGVVSGSSISDSEFWKNSATVGGAAYIKGNMTIEDTEFQLNKATYKGGGVFLECVDESCRSTLNNSQFIENTAEIFAGGGLFFLYTEPLGKNYYANNTAS